MFLISYLYRHHYKYMCIRIVACKISGMLFINRGEMRAILSYQYHMISHPAVGMLNQNPPMHFLG